MPDIFDQITSGQGDIFDQITQKKTTKTVTYGWGPRGFESTPTEIPTELSVTEKGLKLGGLLVGQGIYGTAAHFLRDPTAYTITAPLQAQLQLSGLMPHTPQSELVKDPELRAAMEKIKEKYGAGSLQERYAAPFEARAQELWEAAQSPELALSPDAGWGEYTAYTVAQTLPFMAATVVAGAITGPMGSFAVGAAVEGDAAYREAMADMADRTDLTQKEKEQIANNERIVVGTINGAVELMQVGRILKFAKGKPASKLAKIATRIAKSKLAKSKATQLTIDYLGTIAEESLEEATQEAVQMGTAKIGHQREFQPGEIQARIGQAALGGGISGGILGAGGRVMSQTWQAWDKGMPTDYAELKGEEHPEELTGWYQPEPRIMPMADVEDAVADTAVVSEFHPEGPRKPKIVTPEEQTVLNRLEEEEPEIVSEKSVDVSDKVKPSMYIGNVTKRAKAVWAEIFNKARELEGLPGEVEPTDIPPHLEGAFPTKRTQVEMTRAEAEETLSYLEEAMDEKLMSGESRTGYEIAMMKAMWGDIRELREALGKPKGQMPFRVRYGDRHLTVEIKNPTERIYTAIKGPSKKTLAKYSHKDLVTQGEALIAKIKAVAQTASKMYRQGKREGIRELRLHLRALKEKQRTIRMIRDYRNNLAKRITAPVSENVDPLYRRAIQAMSDRLDPTARTEETKKRLAGLERTLKKEPDVISQMQAERSLKLLKRLYQTPIENISTEQLQDLAEERLRLEKEGRLETQKLQRKRRAQGITDELKAALRLKRRKAVLENVEKFAATAFQTLTNQLTARGYGYVLKQARLERWFETLDGFRRGAWTKFVWEPMKRLAIESSTRRGQAIKVYQDFLEANGIDPALFMGHEEDITLVNGMVIHLSPFQQIGVYVFSQEDTARSHLRDMKFTDADIDMIADRVAKDEKRKLVADWMTEQAAARWEMIERVAREIGVDITKLQQVSKYLRILVDSKKVNIEDQDDLMKNALLQFVPKDYQAARKFLETRKPKAKGPIELDAQLLYIHSVSEVEHFLTMAPMLSQLSHIMADPEFQQLLNDRTYGHGTDILSKWIIDTARGRVLREHDSISRLMHKLNRYGIIYALGYNVPVVMRQSISALNGMAMNPRMIPRFISTVVETSLDPNAWFWLRRDVMEKSPLVRERDMEHYMADQWNKPHVQKLMYQRFGHKIKGVELSKKATSWIRMVDMWTVVHVWKSAYDVAIDEGAREDAARRYADRVVQRTQPMARPEDLPHYFRGGVVAQWMALFQNQVNQNLNFWAHDIYGYRKAGKINNTQVAYRVMMAYTLPALVFGMISRGFRPPDEEQLAEDLFTYAFGAPMFVGRMTTYAIKGWGNSLGMWHMLPEGFMKIKRGVVEQNPKEILKGAAQTIGLLSPGFVTQQMVRTATGMADLSAGDVNDPRRLIWSEWALKQGKKTGKKTGKKWSK